MIIVDKQFDISSITDLNSVEEVVFYLRLAQKFGRKRWDAVNDDLYVYAYFDVTDFKFKVVKNENTIHLFKLDARPDKPLGKLLFNEKKTDDHLSERILKMIKSQYLKDYSKKTEQMISNKTNIFEMYEKNIITLNQLKNYGPQKMGVDLSEMLRIKSVHYRTKYPEFLLLLSESGLVTIDLYLELKKNPIEYRSNNNFFAMLPLDVMQEYIRSIKYSDADQVMVIRYADDEYYKGYIKHYLDNLYSNNRIDLKQTLLHTFNTANGASVPNETPPVKRDTRSVMNLIDKEKWLKLSSEMNNTLYES